MFANTKTYNKADSDIVYMSKVLEEIFDRGIASLKAQGISDLEEGMVYAFLFSEEGEGGSS